MGSISYMAPAKLSDTERVIMSLPDSWSAIRFSMSAQKSSHYGGLVAEDTYLEIKNWNKSSPDAIIWRSNKDRSVNSIDWVNDLIFGGQVPAYVNLELYKCDEKVFNPKSSMAMFKEARDMAARLVRTGYIGDLDAFHAVGGDIYYEDSDFHDKPETFGLDMNRRKISMSWQEHRNGKKANLQPIISVCKKLGLEELDEDYARKM